MFASLRVVEVESRLARKMAHVSHMNDLAWFME